MLYVLFLLFIIVPMGLIVGYSFCYGISPSPTSKKIKKEIEKILPSYMEGKIYELGSGWGNLAFFLAKKYPNAEVIAYEISPIPFLFSKCLQLCFRLNNLKIYREDFFKSSLEDASLVVCYLYPRAMHKLGEKFLKELNEKAVILTHTFAVPFWKLTLVSKVKDLYRTNIYLYKISK